MADLGNLGLLSGLAMGLKGGMDGYMAAQKMQNDERRLRVLENNAEQEGLLRKMKMQQDQKAFEITHGVTQNKETGDFDYTPEEQEKRRIQSSLLKQQEQETTPGENIADIYKSAIESITGKRLPGGLSVSQYKGMAPFVGAETRGLMANIKGQQLEETKNKNASDVGKAYEENSIIKQSKNNVNSLNRAVSLLENKNKPLTAKDFGAVYQDYVNSIATGGAATEGKVHREMPDTWVQRWNAFKQNAGENDDLRNSPAGKELVLMLQENIRTVKDDLAKQIESQAANIHSNYLDSSNQKVLETNKRKLKEYAPNKFFEKYGGAPKPKSEESIEDKRKKIKELEEKAKESSSGGLLMKPKEQGLLNNLGI